MEKANFKITRKMYVTAMRKVLFIAAMCVATAMNGQTARPKQVQRVRPVEFEMHIGAGTAFDGMPGGDRLMSPALGVGYATTSRNSP